MIRPVQCGARGKQAQSGQSRQQTRAASETGRAARRAPPYHRAHTMKSSRFADPQ